MTKQNTKLELLEHASVSKALLAIGLPTMTGMMINALYNLVDAYYVSGLGTSQMGAIAVAFPIGQVIVGIGLLFGNGAASYISRLLGQGNTGTAGSVASTALYGSIAAGIITITLALIFLEPILVVLGATKSILPYAAAYGSIYVTSCIFNIFNVTMNNLATSEGAAKTTMCALLSGALLNIVLDPVFIYGLNLGVAGAAIATALSQIVSAIIYLFYIFNKRSIFSFRIRECRFSKPVLSEIFKIGIPTLVFQLLTGLSITLINTQAKAYGDSVIAGIGAVTRIISMGSLMVFGFLKGFQPVAGYNYGAGKYNRLHQAVRISVIWSTIFCTVFGIVLALFAEIIVACFTSGDRQFIETGRRALRAGGLSFVLFGFYTVYSFLYLALGKGKEGFILGACRQGICFIPVILILPEIWGVNGILYAQSVSDVLSALITVFMAVSLHKQLNIH